MLNLVLLCVAFANRPTPTLVTAAEKKEFIEFLFKLPRQGEFYAVDIVKKAAPSTRVLLALSKQDLDPYWIYPFLALSRGLCDLDEPRSYAVKHFGEIAHPTLRLAWGIMLFNGGNARPEIVQFLRTALETKEQREELELLCGPGFEHFKRKVKEWRPKGK